MKRLLVWSLIALAAEAADTAMLAKGRAEEKRACTACHSLRIVHVQRLTRGQWDAELTKMTGWGTAIREREALLEYLVDAYGTDKPAAPLPRSEDASGKK